LTDSSDSARLFFAGDICFKNDIENLVIDDDAEALVRNHDYRWCNLEGPITKEGGNKINKAGPSLCQKNVLKPFLDRQLFNIFGLANNHIFDFGGEGLKHTLSFLSEKNYHAHGAAETYDKAYQPLIINKNGISIALIAVCEAQFGCLTGTEQNSGYAWAFNPEVFELISKAKAENDFVVVLPHGGLEMFDYPLPEFRNLYKKYIDFGADLVVGGHPHVIQGKEQHKGKHIYYSLGNFIFNYENIEDRRWQEGLGLSCVFHKNGNIDIAEHSFNFVNNRLCLSQNNDVVNSKSALLQQKNESDYYKLVNEKSLEEWQKYLIQYTANPLLNWSYYKSSWLFRKIIYRIFKKYVTALNEVILLHTYKIETNRFVIERALKQLTKTY